MSGQEYIIHLADEDVVVRLGSVVVPGVRLLGDVVVPGIKVMGGVAGPAGQDTSDAIEAHIQDPTPHPAYDDLPSITLLFENGLI